MTWIFVKKKTISNKCSKQWKNFTFPFGCHKNVDNLSFLLRTLPFCGENVAVKFISWEIEANIQLYSSIAEISYHNNISFFYNMTIKSVANKGGHIIVLGQYFTFEFRIRKEKCLWEILVSKDCDYKISAMAATFQDWIPQSLHKDKSRKVNTVPALTWTSRDWIFPSSFSAMHQYVWKFGISDFWPEHELLVCSHLLWKAAR